MESGFSTGTGRLIILAILVVTFYLAFFQFNVKKAYDYTVMQVKSSLFR